MTDEAQATIDAAQADCESAHRHVYRMARHLASIEKVRKLAYVELSDARRDYDLACDRLKELVIDATKAKA